MYYLKRKKGLNSVSEKRKKQIDDGLFPDKAKGVKVTVRKRKPNLVKKLDKVFALYIRLRDCMPGGYGRCISCGKIKSFEELQNGHYISRKNMATRFEPLNCNAECVSCNCFSADHLIGYRENLITKIGHAKFDYLMAARNTTKKWSDFELETMIKYYTSEVRRLSAEKSIRVNL